MNKAGDGVENTAADSWGPDQHGFRFEDLRDQIILITLGEVEYFHFNRWIFSMDTFSKFFS